MQKQASDTVPMDEEGRPVGAHDSELDSVKQELAKWQERVPKLAAALKERTNEVERLKAGGSDAVEADTVSDAGVKARDELITELEAKVKDLTAKHRDLQGELHARDLTGKDLEAEVASWKDKWHSVTQSLDTQSELAAAKKQELAQIREASEQALADATAASGRSLAELQIELDELTARNGNLNETIELANRQIESLGDNLSNLREQLRAKDTRIGELSGSEQDVTLEMQALNARANDFEARALQAEQQVDTDKNEIGNLESEIKQKTDACTRLEQDNERLTRDQDDLLAQMQALKEAHESVLTQQADALSCEHQEMQQKELQALEQRLVEEHAEDIEKASARLSELEAELVTKDNEWIERLAEKEREFEERLGSSESLQQVIQEKDTEIERLHGEQEQQTNELKRLEEVVCHAEETIAQREDERRRLSETLADAETRARQLETQLQERSEFAVTLEEEKQHLNAMLEGAKNEHKVVLEARHKAERHAGEHAEHITQLDGRLERQKELMQQLEVELVETREEYEAEAKQSRAQFAGKENELGGLREELTKRNGLFEEQAAEFEKRMNTLQQSLNKAKESKSKKPTKGAREPDHSTELEALHSQLADYIEELNQSEAQVKELEALPGNENALELQRTITQLEATVRERTDELNQHRWREEMAANDSKGGDDSGKLLVILNQQLNEARADNDRLVKKLKGLDRGARSASASPADDLTRMKGIGPKLVEQLSELGYTSFASIADLSLDDIEKEEHPLYSHRTRINRDRWIAQAAKLAS